MSNKELSIKPLSIEQIESDLLVLSNMFRESGMSISKNSSWKI